MESTVSSKGQVVIPKKIRDSLGIVAGSAVDFVIQRGVVHMHIIRIKPVTTLAAGHGMLKYRGRTVAPDFDVASMPAPKTKPTTKPSNQLAPRTKK